MRSNLKKIEYFNSYIETGEENIKKMERAIESETIKSERIDIVKKSIGGKKLRLIIGKYTAGYPIENLRKEYLELLRDFEKYWPPSQVFFKHEGTSLNQYLDYDDFLWMLSLGFLFKIDIQDFLILVNIIDRDEVKDFLFEFIIRAKVPERKEIEKESYEYGWELYSSLKKAILIKVDEQSISLIKKHLTEEWEKDHQELLKSHSSKHVLYYGYWSFESAAVVAILNLDDKNFRDKSYFPIDLYDYYIND